MAQDLIDKIRAAAQAKNVDPEVAVRIAQAESNFDPQAAAKTSSAKGLFGVIDKTWSGYGGKPGQQKNPDENIRVGTDVIASNTDFLRKNLGRDPRASEIYAAHFFGPTGASTLLSAAPDTPASQLFSAKVLKANPQLQGMNAEQIRGMLSKKMGEGASPAPAPAPTPAPAASPTPAEQIMEPALRSGMTASAEDLGSGYKAALALSFLGADDADKPETDEDLQARLDREEDQASAEMAAYKPKNAFADLKLSATSHLKPVRLAAGGLPFSPTATVKASAREDLDSIKAQYDKFNADADAYNTALNKYKTEEYDPYTAAVAKFNAAAEEWNKGPRTTAFGVAVPTAPKDFSLLAPTAPTISQAEYDARATAAKQDARNRQLAIDAASDPERYGLTINKFFSGGGSADSEDPQQVFIDKMLDLSGEESPSLLSRAANAVQGAARQGLDAMFPVRRMVRTLAEPTAKEALNQLEQKIQEHPFPYLANKEFNENANNRILFYTKNAARRALGLPPFEDKTVVTLPPLEEGSFPDPQGIPRRQSLKKANQYGDGGSADSEDSSFAAENEPRSRVHPIVSPNRIQIGDRDIQTMLLGLGLDQSMLGLNISKMKQGDKENLAHNLLAAYNTKFGDVGVNASVIRPLEAPEGMYMGNLGASYPVGEGRVMAGVNAMRTPDGETPTMGHSMGYSGKVGPGYLNATIMQPKGNPQERQYQMQYSIPFANGGDVVNSNMPLNMDPMAENPAMMFSHGGPVHRADGSPMGGENINHLTPQEIEAMAAAQGPAFVTPGSGRGRQQGPISQALNSGTAYPAMIRGIAELPYDIAGAGVDLTTMAMRPFGYKTEKPVMGSDWIKEKMTDLGARPADETDPTLKGFRTFGELGANLVNPAAVARKAGPIVEQGVKALGKETARQMLRGMEGEGPLAAITPKPLYAVKPRGGTFATSGDINARPISKMDEMLQSYREALESRLPEDQHGVVEAFVDKKVRKYFTNEFGTANDPLRQAMRSGEMPLYGRDVEEFPEYLLTAARDPNAPGHAQAKRHLEKFYDERTGLELKALNLTSPSDADARRRFMQGIEDFHQKERERMTAEGLPADFQNPQRPEAVSLEDIQSYPNITRTVRGMIKAGEEGRLPSGQVWALQNQQPFYDISHPRMGFLDPQSVAETLQSLDPSKLKNMSFDQAMIEGMKNMRVFREYDTAVDRAARGLSVPKEVLGMFTKPVLKSGDAEWVRLTEPAATKLEGKLLHHSVGGYADNPHYNLGGPAAFRSGRAQIFSLRQEKTGLPEVTIEAEKTGDGLKITQIKGDYNSFPSHRADDVFKFMDKHPNLKHISSEYYPRNNNGAELEQKIGVDWERSYDHWKSGLPGEWIATRQDPRRIDYVYGLPEKKAKGGSVERKTTDNRRYL